ncbi:hypothetical protein HPB50_028058 [Hyalomma asiaticum]|nr:hypothetical protein HPB50_028058 [Hyalomma asiaticum]
MSPHEEGVVYDVYGRDTHRTVNLCGAPSAAEETTNSSSVAATVEEATDENATGDEYIDLSDDAASDYEFYVYDDSDDEARDITEPFNDAPPGVPIALVEHNANVIYALVLGPACTPCQCGFFHFIIHFPAEYPIKPPCVRLMNTDGGRERFSLNLHECAKPYFNELGCTIKGHHGDSEHYKSIEQHETIRMAACDTFEASFKGSFFCPWLLREVMLKSFQGCYDKYEEVVQSNVDCTGTVCTIRSPARGLRPSRKRCFGDCVP